MVAGMFFEGPAEFGEHITATGIVPLRYNPPSACA